MRFLLIAIIVAFSFPAQARKHGTDIHGFFFGLGADPHVQRTSARHSEHSYLPHPVGCPAIAFCGCGASVEVFGRSIRNLWLARAWYGFPRTSPAPGMVGVRAHHVFVLRSHVGGTNWLVADYNSGGRRSRLHIRSIAGYTIVNPHARMAMQ